jgi:4'-phosphopantetheinyl transferase EntD
MIDNDARRSAGPWFLRAVQDAPTDLARIPPTLFPAEIVLEQMNPAVASVREIHPAESALVAHAVDARQREFAAGRLCARRALERLGIRAGPLLAEADRRPAWPAGIAGSISHTDGVCGVAVARRGAVTGVGFDVEPATTLPADVWEAVLTEAERRQLRDFPEPDQSIRARLLFSAKEAFYKCYCSAGGGWLDFHDLEIRLTPGSEVLEVSARKALWERAPNVEGRYALTSRFIFTAFTMTAG